jgi:hypothetical protein
MIIDPELQIYLEKHDALFRNPSLEAVTKFYKDQGHEDWARPDVPLASLHKARLQWLDVTDEMIKESMEWLRQHHYANTWREAPPLTPETRDAQRKAMGKEPLK